MGEFVVEAVWGADDAEFFDAAAEWVGDGGINGAPDRVRIFVEGEFGEDEVGAVAADGGWVRGEGDEAGAVGPFDFGARRTGHCKRKMSRGFVVFVDLEFDDLGPFFGFGE